MDQAEKQFPAGTLLVRENDESRMMYIIKKGKVRVFKTYMGQRVTLAVLGAGEVFGELSFFDAEPRIASVECLTDITALVIDGAKAAQEIAGLPQWIFPLFRTVFHRFREADRKITVLQSMNEYQKKNFKTDSVAQTVYHELLRYLKALRLIYDREVGSAGFVPSNQLYSELDGLLGNRSLGLRVFWRLLKEQDFMESIEEEKNGKVVLKTRAIDDLTNYLLSELKSERYLFLSHTSVAVLGRIVLHLQGMDNPPPAGGGDPTPAVTIPLVSLQLERIPLFKDALKELTEKEILQADRDNLTISPALAVHLFTYQSILKAFDHTIISTD